MDIKTKRLLHIAEAIASCSKDAEKYAQLFAEFFDFIVAEKVGESFAKAVNEGDYSAALHACARYYRNKADNTISSLSAKGAYDAEEAEKCIRGSVRVINIDWTFPDGEMDYLFDPTEKQGPRNNEWLWQFNRHAEWINLARAYAATKDERYAAAFQKQLLKWLAQTDIPENWNAPGSAWRTIECGIRLLGSWQIAFDGFKHSPSVADEVLVLMVASMHKQTVHLNAHPTGHNWLMLEANGAYAFSTLFDEFSDSAAHRAVSANHLLKELEGQILPDGMQYELSPDYQCVVLRCAMRFYEIAKTFGVADEISPRFVELMKNTVDAAIALSTPAFTQPRTNDTFTLKTSVFTESAENLFGETPTYRFVNSCRAEGCPPKGETASVFFPYAGFAVMRSDWSADAAYLCFDVGPLGEAHQHQDMLNIILFKGAQELIYDDGGGQYEISAMRNYALSARGHNTVLVDGLPQNRKEPRVYTEPFDAGWISNDAFDYAAATYSDTFGDAFVKPAVHKREVRFCKPDFFFVCDTLTSADGEAHEYELLFHLDTTSVVPYPDCNGAVISNFGKQYELLMIPLDQEGALVQTSISCGVTEPALRGWFDGRNEENLHAATTVARCVKGVKDFRFATLLIPVRRGEALPAVSKEKDGTITVSCKQKTYHVHPNSLNF